MKSAFAKEILLWSLVCYLAAASGVCNGQQPYDAVGKISAPTSAWEADGGSGTLIYVANGRGVVITADHVIERARGQITVDFPTTTTKFAARVLKRNRAYDIAALEIQAPPGIEPPIGVKAPSKEDEPFVRVGYPWNGNGQRCWNQGKYLGFPRENGQSAWANSMLHATGTVESGYSGGAVFTKDGYFCGVVSGNTSPDISHSMDRTWGASGNVLVEFCQSCCGGNCPVYTYPARPNRIVIQPANPTPPPSPQPTTSILDTIRQQNEEIKKLRIEWDAHLKKYGEIKSCQCDKTQQVTKADLEAAIAKIQLTPGPQGPAGPQGPPGQAGQSGTPATVPNKEQHIVIVADRNSSWWPRLAEDIEKTKDTYVGIRVAPVPSNYSGEIPTAVVYEDSVAVRVVPGERNVLDLLSRVRRGMSI